MTEAAQSLAAVLPKAQKNGVSTRSDAMPTRGLTYEELIDWDLMADVGYDAASRIVWFQIGHPLLHHVGCVHCGASMFLGPKLSSDLCQTCHRHWMQQGRPELASWPYRPARGRGIDASLPVSMCRICCEPGFQRPSHGPDADLCRQHQLAVQRGRHDPRPLPTAGDCAVEACDRLAARRCRSVPLCEWHSSRIGNQVGDDRLDAAEFCRTDPTAEQIWELRKPHLDLNGLQLRAQQQVLAILTLSLKAEYAHAARTTYRIAELMRRYDIGDVFDVSDWEELGRSASTDAHGRQRKAIGSWAGEAGSVNNLVKMLRRATTSASQERRQDVWDLAVFGYKRSGFLYFAGGPGKGAKSGTPAIRQTWLRSAAKEAVWAHIGAGKSIATMNNIIRACAEFGITLAQTRADRGEDPSVLGREDIQSHLARLNSLEKSGELSNGQHVHWVTYLRMTWEMAAENDDLWRAPGAPFEHLNRTCRFLSTDTVRRRYQEPEDEKAGQSLPEKVMSRLLSADSIADLRATGASEDIVAAVLIHANTGRRTQELMSLRYECLRPVETLASDGSATIRHDLIYDEPKKSVAQRYLPIHAATARLVKEQQERVRGRYPQTATKNLALFPQANQNKRGMKSAGTGALYYYWSRWIDRLGAIDGPDIGSDGKGIRFDKDHIDPYAFRHTYAQRHADAGVAPDVLRQLMGHDQLSTTQGYYQVSRKRMREAVDMLAPLQLNHRGDKASIEILQVLDSDVDWKSLGGTSVSYGTCFEPANVLAGGQACPFFHQCLGCTHFRTDPSHLHDLKHFLERRLLDQEMLATAAQAGLVTEWAAKKARPDPHELQALHHLVERCQEELARLDQKTRARLDETFAAMDAAREAIEDTLPLELRHGVRNLTVTRVHIPEQKTAEGN